MRRNSLIQLSSFASGRTSRRPIGVLNGLLVCAAVLIASGCTPDPVKPKPDPKPGATNATDPDEPEEGPGETAPDGRPPAPKGVAAGGAGSVSAAYGIGSTARATVLRVQPSERNAELARELIDRVFDQQVPPDPVDLAYRMANLGPQAFDLLVARANSRTLRKPDVVLLMKIFANVELDIEQSALMRLMDRESEAAAIFRRRLLEISDADTLEALLGLIFRSPSPSLAQQRAAGLLLEDVGITALQPYLDSKNSEGEKRVLAVAIASIPRQTVPILRRRLSFGDKEEQLQTLWLLRRSPEPILVEDLHRLLDERAEPEVIRLTIRVLVHFKEFSSIALLMGLRDSRNKVLRREARYALDQMTKTKRGKLTVDEWWDEVSLIWNNLDEHVRAAEDTALTTDLRAKHIRELARISDPDTRAVVRRLLISRDENVCAAAARAAAELDDKEVIPDLIPLLDRANTNLSRAAHLALQRLTGLRIGRSVAGWKAALDDRR